MDKTDLSVRVRYLDFDPTARKRLHPARGIGLAVLIGLTFWIGFFTCAYVSLPGAQA
jgi:hypothetical protein